MENDFANLFVKKHDEVDFRGLVKDLQKALTGLGEVEFLTKTGFAPSTLFWSHGACPRYWYLAFGGAEFDKRHDSYSIDNMQSGTDAHTRIQDQLLRSSLDVETEQELFYEDPPIHCFVDVIIKNVNGIDIPIEIKTTRSEGFNSLVAKNQGRPYQVMQLLLYMHIRGDKYGALLYENKNNHKKLLIPVVMTEENQARIDRLLEWMRKVYQNYKTGELPKVPYRSNSKICGGCPIKDWCRSKPEGTLKIDPLNYEDADAAGQ